MTKHIFEFITRDDNNPEGVIRAWLYVHEDGRITLGCEDDFYSGELTPENCVRLATALQAQAPSDTGGGWGCPECDKLAQAPPDTGCPECNKLAEAGQ